MDSDYAKMNLAGVMAGQRSATLGNLDSTPAVQRTAFHAIEDEQQLATTLSTRVQALATRLLGPTATASAEDTQASKPNGFFSVLEETADTTAAYIRRAHEALDRIERALP